MKKIILLFILFLTFNCFAFDLNVLEEQTTKKVSNKQADAIENHLKDIILNENDFLVVSAKKSEYGKLYDIHIDWLNMTDDKANSIVEKLKSMSFPSNTNSDELTIFITKKPEYEKNKNLITAYCSANEKTKTLKKTAQGYSMYFRTKLYMEWKNTKTDKPVLIYTEIDKNGNVVSYNVLKSAGEDIDKKLQTVLKQAASSIKPLEITSDTLPMMFSFGNSDKTLEKLVKNIDIQEDENFYAVVKIELDKKGHLASAQIEQSSDNETIDEALLKAVYKTDDFLDIVNFEENNKTSYLQFTGIKNHRYFVSVSDENIKQINWIPYLQEVEQQARKNWAPSKSQEFYLVKTYVLLDKDGQIKDKKVLVSSGNKNNDAAALKSVDEGIYPKFPEGFKGRLMPVETTFVHYAQSPLSTRSNKWKNNPWIHLD